MSASGSRAAAGGSASRDVPSTPGTPTIARPFSPAASEVGSLASASLFGGGASARYGANFGAGLSSTNLTLSGHSTPSAQGLAGFNAISTVLNDPRKPSRPIDPSSSRYPAISTSHTELPKVPPGAFAAYLQSVKPAYASLQRNKRLGHAGRARLTADGAEAADGTEGDESGRASLEEARNIATGARKLPPLSSVPQIFFSEDFNLGNPYTFDLVTERYKSVADHGPGEMRGGEADDGGVYDVALNQMLQEKLSYYSDVVEQHLILEISARSTSFFAALGNLQDLSSEAAACLTRVEALKAELQEQDEQEAKAGLRIVREQARRREIAEQSAAVEAVRQLLEQRDLARLLAQGGEWDEALEVVTALRDVLEGRRSLGGAEDGSTAGLPLGINIEFSAVPALAAILPQLSELEEMVGAQLEAELLNVLEADLGRRIGRPEDVADAMPLSASIVDLREVVQAEAVADGGSAPHTNGTASPPPPVDSMPPEDRTLLNRVEPLLAGLVRTGKVDALPAAYRNVVLRAVRQTLRSHITAEQSEEELENLAALLEDDDAASGRSDARAVPGGFAAAGKLRELEHERFLRLADTLFDGFLRALQAVDVHSRIVVRALTEAAKKADSSLSDNDEVHMPLGVSSGLPLQLSSLVHDATSLSHVLASRLLSLRASTHVKLSLPAFLALFHLTWTFVLRSETLAARMVVGLRGAILNQAKSWLVQFHRERIEGAAKRVEEETWGQAEVTPFDQREVNLIVDSATGDPAAFLLPARAGDEDAAPADAENFKTLEIEEKSYFVVGASTHVLRLLAEYLRVVINLPLLTTEAMGRVVEFLKQFNSRTCQVVLGAGAMRSAGLKNITAKHLALASQSLSIVITLIPYVRETVRRHLSQTQAVMLIEFDKLRRDFQEHQFEIHAKLVAIMSDRLTVHCRALTAIDWNAPLPTPLEPSKPVQDLVKETATLHKVLYKYLHGPTVEHVMGQVLASIDKRLGAELSAVEVKGPEPHQRMTEDKAHLEKKLGTLKGLSWSAEDIDAAVAGKTYTPPPAPAPAPAKDTPAPSAYRARIPLFGRKAATNGRTSMDSTGTPGRTSLDGRASLDQSAAQAPALASDTVAETSEAAAQSGDVSSSSPPPEPPAKAEASDEPASSNAEQSEPPTEAAAAEPPAAESEAAETAASTADNVTVATDDGPGISAEVQAPGSGEDDASPATSAPAAGAGPAPPSTPSKPEKTAAEIGSAPPSPAPVVSRPSTPAAAASSPPSAAATPTSPPARAPRMTLQQRLAEAARKRERAAAGGPSSSDSAMNVTSPPPTPSKSSTLPPTEAASASPASEPEAPAAEKAAAAAAPSAVAEIAFEPEQSIATAAEVGNDAPSSALDERPAAAAGVASDAPAASEPPAPPSKEESAEPEATAPAATIDADTPSEPASAAEDAAVAVDAAPPAESKDAANEEHPALSDIAAPQAFQAAELDSAATAEDAVEPSAAPEADAAEAELPAPGATPTGEDAIAADTSTGDAEATETSAEAAKEDAQDGKTDTS